MWSLQTWPASNSGVGYLLLRHRARPECSRGRTALYERAPTYNRCTRSRAKPCCRSGATHLWSGSGTSPFGRRENDRFPLGCPPFLPGHQHRSGDCDGGISSDENTNYQRKGEALEHLAAKGVERKDREEGQPGGQNRPAQRLIDAAVHHIGQRLAAAETQVFADTVEDDDGVVHGIADEGEDGGNHRKAHFLSRQGEEAHGDQGVVKAGHHGSDAVNELESEPEIYQ